MASISSVSVKRAYKSYGKSEVLKDFSIEVQKGTIYGLLGASGCGKTTLLNCLIGRAQVDSGEIWILGSAPSELNTNPIAPTVGYMPQELGLVGEFTVQDALYFFGRIANMSDKSIKEQSSMLTEILDLPSKTKLLKKCSGGQQRRISFACSLIHKPEFLVLDEPTVGADPLVRERIWNFLMELTGKHNTTAIITTHYIDEAQQCDVAGFMRDGRILAQESPRKLLDTFRTDSLERVFFILSDRQERASRDDTNYDDFVFQPVDISGSTDELINENKSRNKNNLGGNFRNRRYLALLSKNWKQFYRNITGLVNFVSIPILLVSLFFVALGGQPKQLQLGVVNSEINLKQCSNVTLFPARSKYSSGSCRFENLSCRFLTYFDGPLIDIVQYDSLEMALQAAKTGQTMGALYFPDDFTHSFEERVRYSPMSDKLAEKKYFNHSEIKVWLDMSNQITGNAVRRTLLDMYRKFIQDLLIPCGYKLKHLDFFTWNYIYENPDGSFKISWLPGVIVTFMFFFGCLVCCELLLSDRLQGIWERSAVAGVSSLEIILSHFTLQSIFVAFHTFEIFASVFLVFRVKYVGNMWVMVLIGYLQGVIGIVAGCTISIVCDAVSTANMVTFAVFFIMYAISGVWWPINGMPIVLQWISKALPFPFAIDAVKDVMFKGWSIDNQNVILGIGMELAWIVGLLVLNIVLLKLKKMP